MKPRIVLWGTKEEEKILIGLELRAEDNEVDLYCIPQEQATEDFYNLMMNSWRDGAKLDFPPETDKSIRPLTASDSLLPEEVKVERGDLILRAQAEWHFVVLSSKLNEAYKQELAEIKERVGEVTEFNKGLWEELKGFWGKVQEQVREKNLFREHANNLRKETNALFDQLKTLRSSLDKEFKAKSEEVYKIFTTKLDNIEEKITKGLGLKPIFEELKNLQSEYRESSMTRKDRDKIWNRLDAAFKQVKEKRFGNKDGGDNGKVSRLTRRYSGLVNAISKMQESMNRDRKDITFQEKRIQTTDGQLEAQIRAAKLKMVQERISSKQLKLDEMVKTEALLKVQIEKEKAFEEKKKAVTQAKAEAKEKIANKIENAEESRSEIKEKLEKAATQIKDAKQTKKAVKKEVAAKDETTKEEASKDDAIKEKPTKEKATKEKPTKEKATKEKATKEKTPKEEKEKKGTAEELLEAVSVTLGESLTDVVETIKAVAEVVADKVSEAAENTANSISEALEEE